MAQGSNFWNTVEDIEREYFLDLSAEEELEKNYRIVKREIEKETVRLIRKIREEKSKLLDDLKLR